MSESVFLGVSGTGAAIARRGDVETVAQGEGEAARVVVLRLAEYHAFEVEPAFADALIEEVVRRKLDVKSSLEQVLADAEREHRVGGFNLEVRACVAVGVHVEVGLQQPVVG